MLARALTFIGGSQLRASLIVSVYQDTAKLRCILEALAWQSCAEFEILVSEDGAAPEVASLVQEYRVRFPALRHLTQTDQGFRKNRALNRAINAAKTDYLIFIDGDCVPHSQFIATHCAQAEDGRVCAGRRVELGPAFSARLLADPAYLLRLQRSWHYLALAPRLHRDRVKGYEVGFVSPWVQRWAGQGNLSIVGCNFSCPRAALEAVNGFNEDFEEPGTGEDSDLEWRLHAAGWRTKSVKFLAPVYHLYHPPRTGISRRNERIMAAAQAANAWRCARGLDSDAVAERDPEFGPGQKIVRQKRPEIRPGSCHK